MLVRYRIKAAYRRSVETYEGVVLNEAPSRGKHPIIYTVPAKEDDTARLFRSNYKKELYSPSNTVKIPASQVIAYKGVLSIMELLTHEHPEVRRLVERLQNLERSLKQKEHIPKWLQQRLSDWS